MSYYNTTKQTGENLQEYKAKSKTQDELIMDAFMEHKSLSPSMVLEVTKMNCPITSIRRSITNLTNEGKLTKTFITRKGVYGRPEYYWRIVD